MCINVGLVDEDNDGDEAGQNEEIPQETPMPVCNKPFVVKKFRDALRKRDFITGELNISFGFELKSKTHEYFFIN